MRAFIVPSHNFSSKLPCFRFCFGAIPHLKFSAEGRKILRASYIYRIASFLSSEGLKIKDKETANYIVTFWGEKSEFVVRWLHLSHFEQEIIIQAMIRLTFRREPSEALAAISGFLCLARGVSVGDWNSLLCHWRLSSDFNSANSKLRMIFLASVWGWICTILLFVVVCCCQRSCEKVYFD